MVLMPIAGRTNSVTVYIWLDVPGSDNVLNTVACRQQANQAAQQRQTEKVIQSARTARTAPGGSAAARLYRVKVFTRWIAQYDAGLELWE